MGTDQTDPRVDDYIATLPGWQLAICRRVRALVHAPDPKVTETINELALLNLFQAVIANNRSGGWRKLRNTQEQHGV
jgi:hypothetical protein